MAATDFKTSDDCITSFPEEVQKVLQKITFQTVAETHIADQYLQGMLQHIRHSVLVNGNAVLMGTDMA